MQMRMNVFFTSKNPYKKGMKNFGIIILDPKERTLLKKLGGFSAEVKTEFLKDSLELPDKTGFIFQGYTWDLNKIRDELTKRLGCRCDYKHTFSRPSLEALLAKEHGAKERGFKIYLKSGISEQSFIKTKFFATFRAETKKINKVFLEGCGNWKHWAEVRFAGHAITIWGYEKSIKNIVKAFNANNHNQYPVIEMEDPGLPKLLLRNLI